MPHLDLLGPHGGFWGAWRRSRGPSRGGDLETSVRVSSLGALLGVLSTHLGGLLGSLEALLVRFGGFLGASGFVIRRSWQLFRASGTLFI